MPRRFCGESGGCGSRRTPLTCAPAVQSRLSVPTVVGGKPPGEHELLFERSNVVVHVRPRVVEPALFVEPAFAESEGGPGDDNDAFDLQFGSHAPTVRSEFCAHPVPADYTIKVHKSLPSEGMETVTT